jgi:hypothetical protein
VAGPGQNLLHDPPQRVEHRRAETPLGGFSRSVRSARGVCRTHGAVWHPQQLPSVRCRTQGSTSFPGREGSWPLNSASGLGPGAKRPLAKLAEPQHLAGNRDAHAPLRQRQRYRAEGLVEEFEINNVCVQPTHLDQTADLRSLAAASSNTAAILRCDSPVVLAAWSARPADRRAAPSH